MRRRRGKQVLRKLHYFGRWHTGVRDTGTKSRRKFQELIDSGNLDVFMPIKYYKMSADRIEAVLDVLTNKKEK